MKALKSAVRELGQALLVAALVALLMLAAWSCRVGDVTPGSSSVNRRGAALHLELCGECRKAGRTVDDVLYQTAGCVKRRRAEWQEPVE